MNLSSLLIALCLLGPLAALGAANGANGAPALEAARSGAKDARATVDSLEQSRAALLAAADALNAQIVRLKGASGAGRPRTLMPSGARGELGSRLEQAQALAGTLSTLDRQVEAARAQLLRAEEVLGATLDAEIERRRTQLGGVDLSGRSAAMDALRSLLLERGRAVGQTAPVAGRTVSLPGVDTALASSTELLELADEARDHAEQLEAQLSALGVRLGDLQSRRRVLRAAGTFARDEALFGEDARNRRVVRASGDGLTAPEARATGGRPSGNEASGATRGDDAETIESQAGAAAAAAPPPEGEDPSGGGDFDGALGDDRAGDPPAPPTPMAVPVGGLSPGGRFSGADLSETLTVDLALLPQLLGGSVGQLSPSAVVDQIRALEARRRELERTRASLGARQKALEERARAVTE